MKKVFVFILTCVAFMACSKDDGGNVIKKATVRGAQLIYQNSAGTRAGTDNFDGFMTIDAQGNVKPIRFITGRGDTLNMNIDKVENLNDEYLILHGDFRIGEMLCESLLVNKTTEAIYVMEGRDIYVFGDIIYPCFEDKNNNLYIGDDKMVYRFNVSNPDNLIMEYYLPNECSLDDYWVNGNGFCYYKDRFHNIKCPGGRIYNMKELIPGSNGMTGTIFCGFNQQFYVVAQIYDENGNYKYDAIYRLDEIGNNELNAIQMAEGKHDWTRDFCPNPKRKHTSCQQEVPLTNSMKRRVK